MLFFCINLLRCGKLTECKITLENALSPKLPIERKIFKERYEAALLSDAILQVVDVNK